MRVDSYKEPKSSFLSVDKDLAIVTNQIAANKRLQKLLYYTTPNCLIQPDLNDDQMLELFEKNIKISPKLKIDGSVLNYIHIRFDNFLPSMNPEFRDNTIEFDIICHIDQWLLEGSKLRPFKIAAELDSMFDKSKLSGIGKLEFVHCSEIVLTDEFMGYCLMYQAVHGEDDRKFADDPNEQASIIENFNQIFNQ